MGLADPERAPEVRYPVPFEATFQILAARVKPTIPEAAVPRLHPFRALRYRESSTSLSDLLAPPYDVISPGQARLLRDRHPANSVRLVLPEGDPPDRYESAARLLSDWIEAGILERDVEPGVTVYRQTFENRNGTLTRHALFAALELSPFAEGDVLPHERTHSGPKRDRLALTLATRTQLSPVFLSSRDTDGSLYVRLLEVAAGAPDFEARSADGVKHAAWIVTDPETCSGLCAAAGSGPLLIADGHHRYETALEVHRLIGEDRPEAGLVLACVVSGSDPGLRIQPTHRAVPTAPPGRPDLGWTDLLREVFTLERIESGDPAGLAEEAERSGTTVLVTGAGAWRLRPTTPAARARGLDEADLSIASVVLDRLVVEGILGSDADAAAHDGWLAYFRDPAAAVAAAGNRGAAFLLPAVRQDAVWRVTGLGRRLPPKSTYYEPKIPSGLLFRPL